MKKKIFGMFLVLALGIVFSGCVNKRLGNFTVISTKNIDWNRAAELKPDNRRTSADDSYHVIVIIPTKKRITVQDAVDRAIEHVPGGIALTDVVVRRKSFWLLLYGKSRYIVEGVVLVDPRFAMTGETPGSKYLVVYSPDGEGFIRKEVTEEEFKKFRS